MYSLARVKLIFGVFAGIGLVTWTANAQVRIVNYNTATAFAAGGNPDPSLSTVLQGIGNEAVNGITKRIDIIGLTEQNNTAGNTSTTQILAMFNSLYGAGTYAKGSVIGGATVSPVNDSSGVIYDQTKFTLVGEVAFGTPSTSGMARQEIRYQFRPIGYGSLADFYVYVGHWKASGGASNVNRRNVEAQTIRANANTLPANSRILYSGDFNLVEGASEPGYQTITAPGANAGIDPHPSGNWPDNPALASTFTWSTSGLNNRLDFQMHTAPVADAQGFSYIAGSYRSFGVNGSVAVDGAINSASNTALPGLPNRTNVLNALVNTSDHTPIVADYRLPAKMNASVAALPTSVIVGATVNANVTVSNVAPVQFSNGADTLNYNVLGSGSLSGNINGADAALGGSNNHNLTFNTATPGLRTGTVSITSSSQEVEAGTFSQSVSTTVLAHSKPSFESPTHQTNLTIDFGVGGWTLDPLTRGYTIRNLADASGFTASLDLDSFSGSGDTTRFLSGLSIFSNLTGGGSNSFTATLNNGTVGLFNASYTLNLSDQNLAGATSSLMTLSLTGRVAIPGDTDFNGIIDFDDYVNTDNGFNTGATGWSNGDFNGDGIVDFDDYVLIDNFFNQQGGGLALAIDWLEGENRNQTISRTLLKVIEHHQQFGLDYANAFYASVPEPTAVALLFPIVLRVRRRRNLSVDAICALQVTVHADRVDANDSSVGTQYVRRPTKTCRQTSR